MSAEVRRRFPQFCQRRPIIKGEDEHQPTVVTGLTNTSTGHNQDMRGTVDGDLVMRRTDQEDQIDVDILCVSTTHHVASVTARRVTVCSCLSNDSMG